MILMGLGDANIDPTSFFTDVTGITCRQYESMQAPDGTTICNQCAMSGSFDVNGMPISCVGQNTQMPISSTPISTLVPAPTTSVVMIPGPAVPVPMPLWQKALIGLGVAGAAFGGYKLVKNRKKIAAAI